MPVLARSKMVPTGHGLPPGMPTHAYPVSVHLFNFMGRVHKEIRHLPAATSQSCPSPAVSAWGRSQAGQDRCAKGLGRQVALSGLGGCLEGERQTDSVTLKSPQAWLGATKSQTPPHSNPPSLGFPD